MLAKNAAKPACHTHTENSSLRIKLKARPLTNPKNAPISSNDLIMLLQFTGWFSRSIAIFFQGVAQQTQILN